MVFKMKKRVIYLIIILLVGFVVGECYIYFTKVFDNPTKDNNLEITKNPLDYGYLKTVRNEEFVDDDKIDTEHLEMIEDVKTATEIKRTFKITMNGQAKILREVYILINNNELGRQNGIIV